MSTVCSLLEIILKLLIKVILCYKNQTEMITDTFYSPTREDGENAKFQAYLPVHPPVSHFTSEHQFPVFKAGTMTPSSGLACQVLRLSP